jgi:hypothetical protein
MHLLATLFGIASKDFLDLKGHRGIFFNGWLIKDQECSFFDGHRFSGA